MIKKIILVIAIVSVTSAVFLWIESDKEPKGVENNYTENQTGKIVRLFYYSPERDLDEEGNVMCSENGLVSVEREINSENIIEDTLKLLLLGEITEQEKVDLKINTEFPFKEFKLLNTTLDKGVLTLEFDDPLNETSGGACRAGIIFAQILATAKQFPEVLEVHTLPEETLFQP